MVCIALTNCKRRFVLPDFSIKYSILAPDVLVFRANKGEANKVKEFATYTPDAFVEVINNESFHSAKSWVVSIDENELKRFGAFYSKE